MVGAVRLPSGPMRIEGAGDDAGGRRLADAAHAGQHEGMGDAAGLERVFQRADERLLARPAVREIGRPVFAGKHPVRFGLLPWRRGVEAEASQVGSSVLVHARDYSNGRTRLRQEYVRVVGDR